MSETNEKSAFTLWKMLFSSGQSFTRELNVLSLVDLQVKQAPKYTQQGKWGLGTVGRRPERHLVIFQMEHGIFNDLFLY